MTKALKKAFKKDFKWKKKKILNVMEFGFIDVVSEPTLQHSSRKIPQIL